MENIKINKQELINVLTQGLENAGSTDWDIYVNAKGVLGLRHSTYDNNGWYEIIDMYRLGSYEDDGKCPGDEGYDYKGCAEWIVESGQALPYNIEIYDNEGNVSEVSLELV